MAQRDACVALFQRELGAVQGDAVLRPADALPNPAAPAPARPPIKADIGAASKRA